MGARKLETKSILKNIFYRKSNGNLISQLKILIQNQAVFETSSTNNFFLGLPIPTHSHRCTPKNVNVSFRTMWVCRNTAVGYRRSKVEKDSTVASLPRLVTPAKVTDMAAQLQGMFRTPWGFVSAKIKFLTVSSRRNGHPQI